MALAAHLHSACKLSGCRRGGQERLFKLLGPRVDSGLGRALRQPPLQQLACGGLEALLLFQRVAVPAR